MTQGNRSGRATRLTLLLAAERLFAERGIEAVSSSEILDLAGQRNKNAIHYHFGGKDGLITAIAEFRSTALNDRRAELLAGVRAKGAERDLTELAATLVLPLAELLDVADCSFLGFLARYHLDRSRRQLVDSVDPSVTATYRDAYALLRGATTLPARSFEIRFGIAMDTIFMALASRQTVERATDVAPRTARQTFVSHLIACVAGCFATPITD